MTNTRPRYILPVIVFSQFAGTSLWFAGNAVISDLQREFSLPDTAVGYITSSIQLGFIAGTMVFAFFTLADRFSPIRLFFICSIGGALANFLLTLYAGGLYSILGLRFITGVFLAGIYPVGMKISSDWYEKGLGKALGYLVGALVLGTAFPHLLRNMQINLSWDVVLTGISILSVVGGLLMILFVKNGPYHKPSSKFQPTAVLQVFTNKSFRSAAFGYFGHMWELYAFWAFIPLILMHYNQSSTAGIAAFYIIAAGALGCILGGYLAKKRGSASIAFSMLLISGICSLLSPLLFNLPDFFFYLYLFIWGFAVVADSPQFSTLVAQTAPKEFTGTALTLVNSIGFSITIVSIELLNHTRDIFGIQWVLLLLVAGPVFGLLSVKRLVWKNQ
ncbi:MAG: MFS transporter [Cyclobacteriaceae bacterium]|nr:MFS transporter [Cyclobacteriaceae bacterium]